MDVLRPIRMSTLFLRTLREDPADAEVESHKLLLRAGYIRRVAPGIYTWLPLGLRVLERIEKIVREEMENIGAQEVHFPELLPREPYEQSKRWEEYGDNLFRLKDRKQADYLLAPTHEEMFTLLVKETYSSYKDFPVTLYQIQTKYRDEARPRAGLLRGRGFVMKDSYSFGVDHDALEESYRAHCAAYQRIFERLKLDVVIVSAISGAMGGSRSEEFLHPTDVGEDTFVFSEGGYAANVEAVTSPKIPAIDYGRLPEAQVKDTPNSTTVDALVEVANDLFPDMKCTAAQILKNVVLKVTGVQGDSAAETESFTVIVAVSGDREVDMRRVEANIGRHLGISGELEVSVATDEDLLENGLVKGYIGPGLAKGTQFLGKQNISGITYLVDARIGIGSSWITGANKERKHVFGLVAGRDFGWDGIIEAAEVRDGDLAPDGNGVLKVGRGIELGHIFQLGTKYAEIFDFKVLDERGKARTVTMGSYGIGITRILATIVQKYSDGRGILWPSAVAPADVHIVAAGKDGSIYSYSDNLAMELAEAGIQAIYDDRETVSAGVKFSDADLIGVPVIIVVGRGLASGTIEVKNRASGEKQDIAADNSLTEIKRMLVEPCPARV